MPRFAVFIFLLTGLAAPRARAFSSQLILDLRSDLWTSVYQNKDTPVRIYELKYSANVYETPSWALGAGAGLQGVSLGRTDLSVGPRRIQVGSDLRDQSVGLNFGKKNDDGSRFLASADYKSVSDEPFQDQRDIWTELTLNYVSPEAELSTGGLRWSLTLNDSKNRGYLNNIFLLMPGVIYRMDTGLEIAAGFPFLGISWVKSRFGDFELSVQPTLLRMQLGTNIGENIDYEAAAGLRTKSYLHVNREEDDLRLFLEESFIENGLKFGLSATTNLKLRAGLGFNRSLYEAKQVFLPVGRRSTIPSDLFGSARWEWTF